MRKEKEIADPNSCFNKAFPDELIFILLARDPAAAVAVGAWANERIRSGRNKPDDLKILSADNWVVEATAERERLARQPSDRPEPMITGPDPAMRMKVQYLGTLKLLADMSVYLREDSGCEEFRDMIERALADAQQLIPRLRFRRTLHRFDIDLADAPETSK